MSREAGVSRKDGALNIHASAVALEGRGLLILGASGAGKSGLALRLMALGAALVADDRVVLRRRDARLVASAPPELAGMIEARGIGLLRARPEQEATLALAVDLDTPPASRMPQPREISYLGLRVELISGRDAPNLDATLVQLLRCGRVP